MARDTVMVNRAPVLTLWAAVVAERLGFEWETALTLGKCVAGLTAQLKGRNLGIYQPCKGTKLAKPPKRGEDLWVELCGRAVPAVSTKDGIRAVAGDAPVDHASVTAYLEGKFGDDLGRVRDAMETLARSMKPGELADRAYSLYEEFRPVIPKGKKGWGVAGKLDLDLLRSLG